MASIRFWLNDRLIEEADASPTTTLLEYLRRDLRLTGTKEGCAEGDCGACTVAVLDAESASGPTYRAINGCLVLLPMLHGRHVYTVEGLKGADWHPVQESLVTHLGSQCGYCTPGVIMSMFEACYRTDMDADWKLDDQMCGNLCRCTGYRPIRDATLAVAGTRPQDAFSAHLDEAIPGARGLDYTSGEQRFLQPASFEALFDAIDSAPEHRFVCGATDLGLDVTKKHTRFPCLISVGAIPEMAEITRVGGGWSVGATVRLTDVEAFADDAIPPLARMLRFFGSRQIKHGATLGGNLCNASPIGDTPPILLALGATAVLRSRAGERRVSLDDFFLGYRQTALQPGEVLTRVEIPDQPDDARIGAYKVSKRRELDISAVAAGMRVRVNDDGVVIEARLAYGGMAATPKRAAGAEAALVGRPWGQAAIDDACAALDADFTPMSDHRGSAWYRSTVARNLLVGFYGETASVRVPRLPDRPTGTVLPEGAA